MNDINIIYIFPFKYYYAKHSNGEDMKNLVNRLIYSILTVNANITNNIKIYVDIDAYRILSILFPFNCNLINRNKFSALKYEIISSQKEPFLLLENFEILKPFVNFNEKYVNNGNILNENSIDYDVTDKYVETTLIEIYGDSYNELVGEINDKINIYNKHILR